MTRHAWILEVRPGFEDEYKRRHDEIWPQLIDEIRRAGQRNYAVFRYGLVLFGTFECDDLEQVYSVMRKSEIFKQWGEFNAPIMKSEINPSTGCPYLLPKMWEFEG